jgi:predicted DsbA family dithiol-disulfide isomerase
MRIDFISDVACPWCAIGLAALERALARIGDSVGPIELHMQPFELNPAMPLAGENAADYLKAKYGMGDAQLAANRARIVERGAAEGFAFGERTWVWNTFDAHRLLHWAGVEGAPGTQHALKRLLLAAYHGQGINPASRETLVRLAAEAGLDAQRAAEIFDTGRFADEVREAQRFWQEAGISGVPAVVIDRRHLVSGGQPSEVFEQALRQVASTAAA